MQSSAKQSIAVTSIRVLLCVAPGELFTPFDVLFFIMIVRIRFKAGNVAVYKWSIFAIPDITSLKDAFHEIKAGVFSCWLSLDLLNDYQETNFKFSVATKRTNCPSRIGQWHTILNATTAENNLKCWGGKEKQLLKVILERKRKTDCVNWIISFTYCFWAFKESYDICMY